MSLVIKLFTIRQVHASACSSRVHGTVWCKQTLIILNPVLKSIQYSAVAVKVFTSSIGPKANTIERQNIDHENCFTYILSAGFMNLDVHTICMLICA